MDNFKIIDKVPRHLEKSLECNEVDYSPIERESLGISRRRWESPLVMMNAAGYVSGLAVSQDISDNSFSLCVLLVKYEKNRPFLWVLVKGKLYIKSATSALKYGIYGTLLIVLIDDFVCCHVCLLYCSLALSAVHVCPLL